MSTLVLIDIQKEYTTLGRPFYLNGIESSLNNARKLLKMARAKKWDIVHVQHFRKDGNGIFNRSEPQFSGFVDGFEPTSEERYFEKHIFSCYSNPEFANFMEEKKNEPTYIIGYGTTKCVLSTIIEGFHRGHHSLIVVEDATYAKAELEQGFSEKDLHKAMIATIRSSYAKVQTTAELLT